MMRQTRVLLCFFCGLLAYSQGLCPSYPAKEYIRFNGRIVAIEGALAGTATITGHIVVDKGRIPPNVGGVGGLSNVQVGISGQCAAAVTDSNGNYTITSLPAGTYIITPVLAGYTFSPPRISLTVAAGTKGSANFFVTH